MLYNPAWHTNHLLLAYLYQPRRRSTPQTSLLALWELHGHGTISLAFQTRAYTDFILFAKEKKKETR